MIAMRVLSTLLFAITPTDAPTFMVVASVILAAAIIAGFRWPGLWVAMLLTKVTPGVGLLWFAVRREWGALAQVAAVTGLVVGASLLIGGVRVWEEWIRLLATSAESARTYTYLGIAPPALVWRLPLAVVVVTWGAVTDRRWTVPLAAFLALPVIWPSGFAILAAIPPLVIDDRRRAGWKSSERPAPAVA